VIAVWMSALTLGSASTAWAADSGAGAQDVANARSLYSRGKYFGAARYAFAALESPPAVRDEAYSWITLSLVKAGLYNSASYFFIKTLESGNRSAIRRVLTQAEVLLDNVGADVLRKYLVQHTSLDDYSESNRSALLYALGKEALQAGDEAHAIGNLGGVNRGSWLWPYAMQLQGTAYAIQGEGNRAIEDFEDCASHAGQVTDGLESGTDRYREAQGEAEDLAARCQAGKARTLYQLNQFDAADQAYDRIQKSSIVWPDILFEQAWNSFARAEYNRSLGKLVSYKSPALSFVFNPEVDVLRAQSYLALCLYADASDVIAEFNGKYAPLGEQVKRFVEGHANDLPAFYSIGQQALSSPISSQRDLNPMLNQFVRGPYFTGLLEADRSIASESQAIHRLDRAEAQSGHGAGLAGFLNQVLAWRRKSVRTLGGMFVKNSLLDYHSELIANYEKMSFINLEMLKRAKDQLVYKHAEGGRQVGSIVPSRRDYQYYWSFNGEFWSDELGDYVFGLESQCRTPGNAAAVGGRS
jgi:tetratricopeptide (TPR) repeat protein